MTFSQELYREFAERRRTKQTAHDPCILKRRSILRAFLDLPDEQAVTLQSSIALLRRLSMVRCLQSVQDIVGIMERKRRSAGGWGSDQELLQCRLIYFLWAVVEQESLEMREFKQLILTLADEQSARAETIRSAYGEKEGVEELIEAWDSLMQNALEVGTQNDQQQQSISDISIIKSKNEGLPEANKENISYFQEEDISTSRHLKRPNHLQNTTTSNPLEKSFQRRDSRTRLHASRSGGKLAGRRSEISTVPPSSGAKTANFASESLSVAEEKNLVARLYRYDQYRQREELKRQSEQERVKAELDQCSFKPKIDHTRALSRGRTAGRAGEVRGYEKAVGRMKSGYKKNRELKDNLQYRVWPTKPVPVLAGRLSAPKFLTRVKDPAAELFQIVFTIGRHSIRVKIRESDKIGDIVANIGQIYALKEDSREYIRGIIQEELNSYYEARCQEQAEVGEGGDNS